MKNRILLTVLLTLGVLALWWLSSSVPIDGDPAVLMGSGEIQTTDSSPAPELPAAKELQSGAARLAVGAELTTFELQAGDHLELEGARSDGSVLVEVRLDLPEGMPRGDAHPFAGSIVHTQSWERADDLTFPFEAQADERGVARFVFDGAVHLDWFRAELPSRFGSLTAFEETHVDLAAGTLYRTSLVAAEGARVTGRVVDANGAPLAGVEVSAYQDGDGLRESGAVLENWYPGHYRTQSTLGGWFAFDALPAESMFVGVAPGDWLQIQPDHDGNFGEGCTHALDPGQSTDVGTLMLAAREVVQIHVVDRDGKSACGAILEIHPLGFGATRLLTEEAWERQFVGDLDDEVQAQQLERESEQFARWPYSVAELMTDEQGNCTFIGVAGRWRVIARPLLGRPESHADVQMELPVEALTIQLPNRLSSVTGKVLSRGTLDPVGEATVELDSLGDKEYVRTNSRGAFSFQGVVLQGGYTLEVSHADYFASTLKLSSASSDLVVQLRPAQRIDAWLENQEGKRLPRQRLWLVRRITASGAGPVDPEQAEWLSKLNTPIAQLYSLGTGNFSFRHLYPGDYEIALLLPVTTGETGMFGEPLVEPLVWQTWVVSPVGERQPLVADLSDYTPAKGLDYARLMGSITGEGSSDPLPGVRIDVIRAGIRRTIFSDAEGRYDFLLPVGRAKLEFTCAGFESAIFNEKSYHKGRYSVRRILKPLPE